MNWTNRITDPISFEIDRNVWRNLRPSIKKMYPDRQVKVGYLLTTKSHKAELGLSVGVLDCILYLAPATTLGKGIDFCASSTIECVKACIAYTGQLGLPDSQSAMIARSLLLLSHPQAFKDRLFLELHSRQRSAIRNGLEIAFRPNGTSDLPWESRKYNFLIQDLNSEFPDLNVYDYTKHIGRVAFSYRRKQGIEKYHLTFSWSGQNADACMHLDKDVSIAVPFACDDPAMFPTRFLGRDVINGDQHDLRYKDPVGCCVGLTYKLPKKVATKRKGTHSASDFPKFVVQSW